jgi:hypothetical protein
MTELERSLAALAAEIEWPETPDLAGRLELAPQPAPRPRPRRRRALALAFALLVLALGVAFAVPQARTAILRFFHLRGVTVEIVDTLPTAQERALGADLGTPVTADGVEANLGFRPKLPPSHGKPQLYEQGDFVSAVIATPRPVLLTQFRSGGNPEMLKKLSGGATAIEPVTINGEAGLWLTGAEHVFIAPNAPPRLAGNVLLWQHGDLTFRLEGRGLTRQEAFRIARSID